MDGPRRDRVLRVDLTAGTVESEPIPEPWLREFVGGKGLGARYLYEELDAGVDPLGPDNALLFVLGPLSGHLPGESRYAAITKSPLTGGFLDSYSGGEFADALAGALADHMAVLITGVAAEPTVLVVDDGEPRLEPTDLWGADTVETCEAYPDAAVACIGPAGENAVEYATVATDAGDHHAGRGGAGAVMGAKRLKAVVARGDPPEELPELVALREKYERAYEADETGKWQAASETLESVNFANEVGVLSTRGWQEGRFEAAEEIGIDAAREAAVEREGDARGFRVEAEEGETVPRGAAPMTLGAGLGVDDFDAVATLGETCDRLGLDVISAGNAVAWAMRANEEGLLDAEHDGLSFGDAEAARDLIRAVATRADPLADALAEGVDAAAARFGGDDMVPTVKSMELPSYDPRGAVAMALAYATSDRGACHRRARPVEQEVFAARDWETDDRVEAVLVAQNTRSTLWSLIVDDFVGETLWDDLGAEWLAAVGRDTAPAELRTAGERIWTLTRLFNAREGFDREDDALPAPLRRPLRGGPADGERIDPDDFESLLGAYYRARGWGPDGLPTRETVERLGLAGAVDADTPLSRGEWTGAGAAADASDGASDRADGHADTSQD
ncbi:MAG: aldehyde ferredoxin oxidoreductase family protein [Haloferacaceae archaeon]